MIKRNPATCLSEPNKKKKYNNEYRPTLPSSLATQISPEHVTLGLGTRTRLYMK